MVAGLYQVDVSTSIQLARSMLIHRCTDIEEWRRCANAREQPCNRGWVSGLPGVVPLAHEARTRILQSRGVRTPVVCGGTERRRLNRCSCKIAWHHTPRAQTPDHQTPDQVELARSVRALRSARSQPLARDLEPYSAALSCSTGASVWFHRNNTGRIV